MRTRQMATRTSAGTYLGRARRASPARRTPRAAWRTPRRRASSTPRVPNGPIAARPKHPGVAREIAAAAMTLAAVLSWSAVVLLVP